MGRAPGVYQGPIFVCQGVIFGAYNSGIDATIGTKNNIDMKIIF